MATLPNMSLVLPTLGGSSGVWDDLLEDIFELLDAHDHKAGKGLRINTSAITIDADLTFSSTYAPTALHRITFASVAALAANNKSIFVSSADNELYWRTNAGVNVKITSGAALNVAAFTNGIGGDYASVAAALNYDNANTRYTHKGAAGTNWAKSSSGSVQIFETGTAESVCVQLVTPAALGASYDLTFATALPGSTSVVQVSSAGALSYSNTIANAVTLSSSLSVGTTLGVTGITTTSGALTIAGGLIASGTISPAALGAGATNDYAPAGFSTALWLRLQPNAAGSTLNGLAGGAAGRIILITNIQGGAGVVDITLADENAGSTAANRFTTPGTGGSVIGAGESMLLIYDGVTSRWRPFVN